MQHSAEACSHIHFGHALEFRINYNKRSGFTVVAFFFNKSLAVFQEFDPNSLIHSLCRLAHINIHLGANFRSASAAFHMDMLNKLIKNKQVVIALSHPHKITPALSFSRFYFNRCFQSQLELNWARCFSDFFT